MTDKKNVDNKWLGIRSIITKETVSNRVAKYISEHMLVEVNDCWNYRIIRPRIWSDYSLNHAMYHRIDALLLMLSKLSGKSFCETCKDANIDYDTLQTMNDIPEKTDPKKIDVI